MLRFNDVGRKKAQHRSCGAIHQETLFGHGRDDGLAGRREIQSPHQAASPDFADEIVLVDQFAQTLLEVRTGLPGAGQDLIEHVEDFKRDAAGERVAPESASVHSRRQYVRRAVGREHGADRHAAAKRFGQSDDVRPDSG